MKTAILLAAVAATLILAVWALRPRQAPRVDSEIQQEMLELSEMAIQLARTHDGTILDYGLDSVENVERILGAVHEQHVKKPLPLDERRDLAVRYGAYIGEVIRRKWGGHWARDHAVGGKDSFPIRWKTHDSFPIVWCFKRIKNGPEDNVWHKLQVLSSDDYDHIVAEGNADAKAP